MVVIEELDAFELNVSGPAYLTGIDLEQRILARSTTSRSEFGLLEADNVSMINMNVSQIIIDNLGTTDGIGIQVANSGAYLRDINVSEQINFQGSDLFIGSPSLAPINRFAKKSS